MCNYDRFSEKQTSHPVGESQKKNPMSATDIKSVLPFIPLTIREWRRCHESSMHDFTANMADRKDFLGLGVAGEIKHVLILQAKTDVLEYKCRYYSKPPDDDRLYKEESSIKFSRRNAMPSSARTDNKHVSRMVVAKALAAKKSDMNVKLEFITTMTFAEPTVVDCGVIRFRYPTATLTLVFDNGKNRGEDMYSELIQNIPADEPSLARPCYEIIVAFSDNYLPCDMMRTTVKKVHL